MKSNSLNHLVKALPHNHANRPPHRRSEEAEQRRFDAWQRKLKDWETRFTRVSTYDRRSKELISTSPVVSKGFELGDPGITVEEGEILVSPYGDGTLQRLQ